MTQAQTLGRELNLPQLSDDITRVQATADVQRVIAEMNAAVKEYESWLSAAAVKYGISVDIGDYGSGKFVVIDEHTARIYGREIGDWVSSSETC